VRRVLPTTLALLAIGSPVALAQGEAPYQTASIDFGTTTPAIATYEDIAIDYVNPSEPDGKPPAVRKVETFLQGGARYHSSAVALCTASDAELMAQGEAACPPESKIGEGFTTVDTGVSGPGRFVEVDIDFFNNTGELIYLNTVRGAGARVVVRGQAYKRRVVTELDMLPGSPPDGGAIDTVQIRIGTLAGAPDAEPSGYLTTPPRCPRRGTWINRIRFTYANGQTQETSNEVPCVKSPKSSGSNPDARAATLTEDVVR
jgi:hypothetical protein